MKKLYVLLSVTLISYSGYCQNVYAIEADSIKLSNESSNSELIIENSTRNIPGFLYNTGNGRTEFREILNGGQNGDSTAYHNIEQGTDSTYFTVSNLNGGIDTVQFVYGSSTTDVGSGVTQAQLDDSTAAIRADFPGANNSWGLTGNSGTTSSNFIGTTDNKPIRLRVNNITAGTIGDNFSNAIGDGTLYSNTSTGYSNTVMGYYSMSKNTVGNSNTAFGYKALQNNISGIRNTGIGYQALVNNVSGNYNIGLGFGFPDTNKIASNTFYVSDSTYHMKYKLDSAGGTAPSVIGKDANGYWHVYETPGGGGNSWGLTGNSGTTSTNFIGTTDNQPLQFLINNKRAGYISEGIGQLDYNTSIGVGSLYTTSAPTTQTYGNTAFGGNSLGKATSSFWNSAFGTYSLGELTTGGRNTGVGGQTLSSITNESYNTAVGYQASQSIAGFSNTSSLGYSSTPTQSNQVVLGNNNVTQVLTYGNILSKIAEKSIDPTTTDIPNGFTAIYKNTTTGITYLWANDGGNLIKRQLVSSVPEFSDNSAALSGGLTVGDEYRTGDFLKIVH